MIDIKKVREVIESYCFFPKTEEVARLLEYNLQQLSNCQISFTVKFVDNDIAVFVNAEDEKWLTWWALQWDQK